MANLATTQAECSNTSSELIDLLLSFAKNADANETPARKEFDVDSMESLIRVLNTPTYVEGIMYMHGKLIPIISLRSYPVEGSRAARTRPGVTP
jgi:hypothetical protein